MTHIFCTLLNRSNVGIDGDRAVLHYVRPGGNRICFTSQGSAAYRERRRRLRIKGCYTCAGDVKQGPFFAASAIA